MINYPLTNLEISKYYRDVEYVFTRNAVLGKFAEWVVRQSPYDTPDITAALVAFNKYISHRFDSCACQTFTYEELKGYLSMAVFKSIPEIEILNHRKNKREGIGFSSRYFTPEPDDDFIDLGALAKNVFYMILREQITQS